MKDFNLTKNTLQKCFDELQAELETTPSLILSTQNADTGKWGMAKIWRAWMASTAEFMARNGCKMPLMISLDGQAYGERAFNADDAHLLFTHQHLGVDKDGTRLSWSQKGRDGMRAATKGERFHALQQHEIWASERGIILFKTSRQ